MVYIEALATCFGILCVWLTLRQNIWCWPTGLVQVSLYIFIFWNAWLYADMALHILYVALSIYGWINWREGHIPLRVSRGRNIFLWLPLICAGTLIWGYSLKVLTDASLPYIDSFVVMNSLVAQWLMAKKKIESWIFWITADVTAIALYAYKDLYLTAGLYLVFLGLAIAGYFSWRKELLPKDHYPDIIST